MNASAQHAGKNSDVRVLLVSAGLEHARRGLESFFHDCSIALRDSSNLKVTLCKGSGARKAGEVRIPTLRRDGRIARLLGSLTRTEPWAWEGVSFAAGLLPLVLRDKPDVIFFGDRSVGHVLFQVRRALGLGYRLVLHNGSPVGPPYPRWDHVQHTAPMYLNNALAAGEPPTKHSLLPLGSFFPDDVDQIGNIEDIKQLRTERGLPLGEPIVLSVSAINKGHKRVDYLVKELARLPEPRPFLVVLGQEEQETPEIRSLAEQLLGKDRFLMLSVPFEEVCSYYRCADIFAMCSLTEGFGRTYVEALGYGMPSIAHDSEVTRYVLGEWGTYVDLAEQGRLSEVLRTTLANLPLAAEKRAQARALRNRYSWSKLGPQYENMLLSVMR